MSKTLTFNQAVGRSVKGGPFKVGKTYIVDDVTLKHPLIAALMDNGKVIAISSKNKDAIDARVDDKATAPARGRPPKVPVYVEPEPEPEAPAEGGVENDDANE